MNTTNTKSTSLSLLTCALLISAAHASPDGWFFGRSSANAAAAAAANNNNNNQLERDSSLFSVNAGQRLNGNTVASRLFALGSGRLPGSVSELQTMRQLDLFQCVDERKLPFETFTRQYNRTFADESERIERWRLFYFTLKRSIMLNRIVQNEILNATNYQVKPEIRNYHFIEPISGSSIGNAALWYADITDCELGLIKNILFELIHRIETNDLAYAYKLLDGNREYLPTLFNEDGFEQLANILLVRLYDRFQGDHSMNRLFEWPVYLKKLAAYVYSQRQLQQPQHKSKMALISFAYPAYFKDVRYNLAAINRTGDNLRANEEHKRFNAVRERKFSSLSERNKRLAIFRQRLTLLSHLNDEQLQNDSNVRLVPEWQRVQYLDATSFNDDRSAKLVASNEDQNGYAGAQSNRARAAYKLTQFSDLTDVEFVAFLSNDFSLLEHNKESQEFLDRNFRHLRPLDSAFRWELAAELELRRASTLPVEEQQLDQSAAPDAGRVPRLSLRLAKQVIDELISDVGLPIGPASVESISEEEHYRMFERLGRAYQKSYVSSSSSSEQAEERQRRYEVFKQNYGRFVAWWTKESWQLDEGQQLSMLRLADMSWLELKLSLFKICCLNSENLAALSSINSTINYLGSHTQLMCSPLVNSARSSSARLQQQESGSLQELNALELYYYYSVHFNKHSLSRLDFDQRLEIFKRNVDSLRRHSCRRSLTLYESLRLKKPDILNTMDVIDPRRSHTDDLNLDRFEYFRLPGGADSLSDPRADLVRLAYQTDNDATTTSTSDSSRAGISYRREPFAPLLSGSGKRTLSTTIQPAYIERLVNEADDSNEYARKYARNNVKRVYDLVVARYKFCMKTTQGVDLEDREVRQQCQASGPLADQAAASPFEAAAGASSGRLRGQQSAANCQFYWQGLEPWAANLVAQDELSARLIREAKCATQTYN